MLRVQKYKRSSGRSDDTKRVMVSFLSLTHGCVNKTVVVDIKKRKNEQTPPTSGTLICAANTFIYGVLFLEANVKKNGNRCIFIAMQNIFGGFVTLKKKKT